MTTWGINSAGRGPVQSDLAPMKTKTHFAFRVDIWDDAGNSIVEYVAGVDDFEVAEATFPALASGARITLRQGIRIVHDTGYAATREAAMAGFAKSWRRE